MAKLINSKTGEGIGVQEGDKIKSAARELGVLFGCEHGNCGTCMIDVVEGEENLSDLTEEEKDLERDERHRLACQCRIKQGDVKIEF